jgi:hypothetical protein
MPSGKKTRQDTPEPTAKAKDAQVPEPPPQKAFEDLEDGNSPTGQGEDGKDTHSPPAVATALTQAVERAAKAPRPLPNWDAWNT